MAWSTSGSRSTLGIEFGGEGPGPDPGPGADGATVITAAEAMA